MFFPIRKKKTKKKPPLDTYFFPPFAFLLTVSIKIGLQKKKKKLVCNTATQQCSPVLSLTRNWGSDFPGDTVDRSPLPKQRTWVWSLVQEEATCCGATEAYARQTLSLCSRACEPQLLKTVILELVPEEKLLQWEARVLQQRVSHAHRNQKAPTQQGRPSATKNNK